MGTAKYKTVKVIMIMDVLHANVAFILLLMEFVNQLKKDV